MSRLLKWVLTVVSLLQVSCCSVGGDFLNNYVIRRETSNNQCWVQCEDAGAMHGPRLRQQGALGEEMPVYDTQQAAINAACGQRMAGICASVHNVGGGEEVCPPLAPPPNLKKK